MRGYHYRDTLLFIFLGHKQIGSVVCLDALKEQFVAISFRASLCTFAAMKSRQRITPRKISRQIAQAPARSRSSIIVTTFTSVRKSAWAKTVTEWLSRTFTG
jgi:hypothetical protein